MKLLTATTRTQGQRPSDFTWTVEGELVMLGLICGVDEREGPDGGCGCGRSFVGLNSHRATTTAMVRDVDLSLPDVALAVTAYFEQAGWAALMGDPARVAGLAAGVAGELADEAGRYLAGTILEHRGADIIAERVAS